LSSLGSGAGAVLELSLACRSSSTASAFLEAISEASANICEYALGTSMPMVLSFSISEFTARFNAFVAALDKSIGMDTALNISALTDRFKAPA